MTFWCRIYLSCDRVGIPQLTKHIPVLKRPVAGLLRRLLPDRAVWVRVRAGIAKGLWMRLNLRKEVRLWLGEHEPWLQAGLLATMEEGLVFYDVWAHVGSIALGVARAIGPSGRVIAFEADPGNVECLVENRDRNALQTLEIVHAAVWSESSGAIRFRQGGEKRSHGGVEMGEQHPVLGTGELLDVPAVTIDDFIAKGGPIPRLVKVDVEGGEYEVLRGAERLFYKHRPLLVTEVHHQRAEDQIRGWLEKMRYESRWIAPPERHPCCVFAWAAESSDGKKWQ